MRTPDVRASDADRERAVELLLRHAGAGRLTVDELDDRIEQALRAVTVGQLEALLDDLPRGLTPSAAAARPKPKSKPPRMPGNVAFASA